MQKIITLSFLIAFAFALCGCVNRTVRNEQKNPGNSANGSRHGSSGDTGKIISEKRIWIWQDEFRNH